MHGFFFKLMLLAGTVPLSACTVQTAVPSAPFFGFEAQHPPLSSMVKMLKQHPLTVYDASEGSYALVIGSVSALYHPNDNSLRVSAPDATPAAQCHYSTSGLKDAEQSIAIPTGGIERKSEWCENLLKRLDPYLWAQPNRR